MNRHTIRVLEFEKIRDSVREYCLTEEASQALRRERISTDPVVVAELLSRATAMRACLEGTSEFPHLSFPPLIAILESLQKPGSVLEPEELASIMVFSRSSFALRAYLGQSIQDGRGDSLKGLVECVPDLKDVSDRLARFLEPDGTIREREIPALKTIRAQINRAQQDLQREAQALLRRDDTRRYWNSTVPTQREGRTVLALKADHRGKVEGIVHEVSATGATIFIEPKTLVTRNNGLTEAQNRYQAELLRIMRELSTYAREHLADLEKCVSAVSELDAFYARARYAMVHDCICADSSQAQITLKGARHPLLGTDAVPISVEYPTGKRLLIVTGPNTGGKTVTLKTVGLLALMNQFGMEIPAGTGTSLPVFTGVFADVGDEQSIEQSLSTFSGHMLNIGRILASTDDNSLVLLDELGSGTDPEEGGALAMAILDELLRRGPFCLITTHHGALKHYGFTQPAAANASVEFDAKSLRPTYRILPGVPGSSHAIDVAAHMGLLRRVTRAAREYLTGQEYDTGHIIRTLTDREQELHRERESIRAERESLAQGRERLAHSERDLQAREADLRDQRLRDLERWSADARKELENLVRELREGELTKERTRRVKEFIKATDHALQEKRIESREQRPPHDPAPDSGEAALDIRPGMMVRIRSAGKDGRVLRRAKGDSWQVQVGNIRMQYPANDLTPVKTETDTQPLISVGSVSAQAKLEIDLRGRRLDEALDEVDRQIDQALISGVRRFGVIHGTGEGVLQKGVRDHLRAQSHVASVEFAAPEDGGFGKTIVNLR